MPDFATFLARSVRGVSWLPALINPAVRACVAALAFQGDCAECGARLRAGQVVVCEKTEGAVGCLVPVARLGHKVTQPDRGPSVTQLILAGTLDAELAGLLWLLVEHGVPLVAAARVTAHGEDLRSAMGRLAAERGATDDGALAGGTVRAESLEDVLRLTGSASADFAVGDEARDLGVVCVLHGAGPADEPPTGFVVSSAHYVRPVERDAAGHLQRRPPGILSAWDERGQRFDHFFWAITDELATRAGLDGADFDTAHRRRAALLRDLVEARVMDDEHIRRHIDRAALVDAHLGAIRANAPN